MSVNLQIGNINFMLEDTLNRSLVDIFNYECVKGIFTTRYSSDTPNEIRVNNKYF
jgi:hypothetical protein